MSSIHVSGKNGKELKLAWAKERFERAQAAVQEAIKWYEQCQYDLTVIEKDLNDPETESRYNHWCGVHSK